MSTTATPPSVEYKGTNRIPRIIHQIWMDKNNEPRENPPVPEQYQILRKGWMQKNPHYQFILWDGKKMRDFVAKHYTWFLPVYDEYPAWIQRCDIFRFLVLYETGGVYLDMDFRCFSRVPEYLERAGCFFSFDCNGEIQNCVMGSSPKHPLFLEIIQEMKNNPLRKTKNVLDSTGPPALTRIIEKCSYRHPDCLIILNPRVFFPYGDHDEKLRQMCLAEPFPETVGAHEWQGGWKTLDLFRDKRFMVWLQQVIKEMSVSVPTWFTWSRATVAVIMILFMFIAVVAGSASA